MNALPRLAAAEDYLTGRVLLAAGFLQGTEPHAHSDKVQE